MRREIWMKNRFSAFSLLYELHGKRASHGAVWLLIVEQYYRPKSVDKKFKVKQKAKSWLRQKRCIEITSFLRNRRDCMTYTVGLYE